MGDRRRRSMAMQMTQYQARIEIEDAELINAEAEFVNSFMQYEHHNESSHRSFVTGHLFVQRDRKECHDRMMKDYFIKQIIAIENLKCFYQAIQVIYGATYLRKPNHEHLKKLLRKANKRGFPGMIGSLDCMHWEWKICPTAWANQFKGCHNKPTIMLEAVASYDTWIWHAFFGAPGSNNDINIIWSSPLFDYVVNGWAPEFQYKVNGNRYELGYYLTDDIYLSWFTFVKSFSHLDSAKKKLFSQRQKSYRKDVERAFEILQARLVIVRGPARFWQTKDLHSIMMTCIILHNIIVEDEYIEIEEDSDEDVDDNQPTHARSIAKDVEYLALTTYET
ncbi:uncharacterized protein [Pyrus communis]|uniref:uncharacterized protein n=1 Tax=Pyrus communis TaxID=23211 RepID=UPI0035BEBF4F